MKQCVFFLLAFLLTVNFPAAAENQGINIDPEAAFKKIGAQWLEFEETAGKKSLAPEWMAVQLKKVREDFKKFAFKNPDTPWSDDAYFLAAALESNPEKSLAGKIFLIEHYPESSAEEWTRSSLSFALPNIEPLDAGVRMDICFEYLKMGKIHELEMLAIESAEKYPELGTQFEILVTEPENPAREKVTAKRSRNEH